jgi:hypothetical protein
MGMVFRERPERQRRSAKIQPGVIGERTKMPRELKKRRTLKVTPSFEPDRIARLNLQVAYEKIVSPDHYRIISPKPRAGQVDDGLHPTEEVSG